MLNLGATESVIIGVAAGGLAVFCLIVFVLVRQQVRQALWKDRSGRDEELE